MFDRATPANPPRCIHTLAGRSAAAPQLDRSSFREPGLRPGLISSDAAPQLVLTSWVKLRRCLMMAKISTKRLQRLIDEKQYVSFTCAGLPFDEFKGVIVHAT